MKRTIKVLVYQIMSMQNASLKNWDKNLRNKIMRLVHVPRNHITEMPTTINNKKKFADWIYDYFGTGKFRVSGYTKGYTKTRTRWITIARIELEPLNASNEEQNYRIKDIKLPVLSRYWFWKGD